MKKKIISGVLISSMMLSLTSCGLIAKAKTADQILTDVAANYEDVTDIKDMNMTFDVVVDNAGEKVSARGEAVVFYDDNKSMLSLDLASSAFSGNASIYIEDDMLTVSALDTMCYKVSMDTVGEALSTYLMSAAVGFEVDAEDVEGIQDSLTEEKADEISEEEKAQLEKNKKIQEDLVKMFIKFSKDYEVADNKEVDGKEVRVIKGSLTRENMIELINYINSVEELEEAAAKLPAEEELSEDMQPVPFELYVHKSKDEIAGFKFDIVDEVNELKINFMMTMGTNDSEDFEIPEGKELTVDELGALIAGIMMASSADMYSDMY